MNRLELFEKKNLGKNYMREKEKTNGGKCITAIFVIILFKEKKKKKILSKLAAKAVTDRVVD